MLASITPLGERGRQATWGITVTAFLLGSTGAGALGGALAGALGALALAPSVGTPARLTALALAALVAVVLDARGQPIPGPRRQVNERWLDEYRGWVYGLGYGAQLGLGVTTVVTSAATYLALVAAFLTANAGRGALAIGCYGAIRGLTPLLAARVRTPQQLLALHRRLVALRASAARGGIVLLAMISVVALAAGMQ